MSIEIIKKIPQIIEDPVIVLQSMTVAERIVMFGDVYDNDGVPVLVVLGTTGKKGESPRYIQVFSAYGKNTELNGYLKKSTVLYPSKNTKKVSDWLTAFGLKLSRPSTKSLTPDSTVLQNAQSVNPYSVHIVEIAEESEKSSQTPSAKTQRSIA